MSSQEIIQKLIDDNEVESVLKLNSTNKDGVRALQYVLYNIGFGSELNWSKYGADGAYGQSCTRAVKNFLQKNDLPSNGEVVTKEIAQTMLDRDDIVDDLWIQYCLI